MYKSIALLALLPSAFAHFVLNYPVSLGFDDDAEGTGPCGGFEITFNETRDTNVSVGGFATTSKTTHPQANWLFRATLSTAEPFNWTNIVPVVQQYGLGDFCLQNLTVPESFAGQRGVIQVIQNAVDGNLYQVSRKANIQIKTLLITNIVRSCELCLGFFIHTPTRMSKWTGHHIFHYKRDKPVRYLERHYKCV